MRNIIKYLSGTYLILFAIEALIVPYLLTDEAITLLGWFILSLCGFLFWGSVLSHFKHKIYYAFYLINSIALLLMVIPIWGFSYDYIEAGADSSKCILCLDYISLYGMIVYGMIQGGLLCVAFVIYCFRKKIS